MDAWWDLWYGINQRQTKGWEWTENCKWQIWSSSSQQFKHNPWVVKKRYFLGGDGGWRADSKRVTATHTNHGAWTQSARAAKTVPALKQIAWLKSKVRALIAWAHVKSGLSSGNPHRFDGGDRERRGISVFWLVVTLKWAAVIENGWII